MMKPVLKSKIASAVIYVIAFLVTIGALLIVATRKPKAVFPAMDKDKTQVLFLGDSNIDYGFEGEDIPVILSKKTGMVTYNAAFGGTCAGELNEFYRASNYRLVFNLGNLTRMMQTRDFSAALRNRAFVEQNMTGIENKTVILEHLDYEAMDYVILHYGLNDYAEGEEIEAEDPYLQTTYCGGLRYGIEQMHKLCPNAKIILSSITFCWNYEDWSENGEENRISGHDARYGDKNIDGYRDGMKKVAGEYDYVYFLDNLEGMGINEENADDYIRDDMHFNQDGRELYVEGLTRLLSEIEGRPVAGTNE